MITKKTWPTDYQRETDPGELLELRRRDAALSGEDAARRSQSGLYRSF